MDRTPLSVQTKRAWRTFGSLLPGKFRYAKKNFTLKGDTSNMMIEFVKEYKTELLAVYVVGFKIGVDVGMLIERSILCG